MVARLSDGKILWSDLTGHCDIGWVADVSSEHEGLEFGAWSKPKDGVKTFRLYTGTGKKIFEEPCESPKYTKPIRWLGNGLAQIMIVRSGSTRDLAEWKDGAWHILENGFYNGQLLPRRYAKGDIWGDSRDELITASGRTAWIHTNEDPPEISQPGIRDQSNYWAGVADAGASYCYYPFWLYPNDTDLDPPWILLTNPAGGETWKPGSRVLITWTSSNDFDFVRLDYTINYGRDWIKITSRTANDGARDWIVPEVLSDSCLVMITHKDSSNIAYASKIFSISPEPAVTDTTIVMEKDGVEFRITIAIESLR